MGFGVTDWGKTAWLNVLLGSAPKPASYYIALLTGEPDEQINGSQLADIEPVGGGYSRKVSPAWTPGEGGFVTTTAAISFGTPTADWGQIEGWALCSAASKGNVYAYGEFPESYFVASGNTFSIARGRLTIALGGPSGGF